MKRTLHIDRNRMAAIFIDLQEEHRADPRYLVEGYAGVLAEARRLQDMARRHGVPLYHAAYVVDPAKPGRPFHPMQADGRSAFSDKDDPRIAICAEVASAAEEAVIFKSEPSLFGASSPAEELRRNGIEWLAIAGVWTEACVDATVKDAIALGFHVLLVKDACGTASTAMHQTAILNLANRLYGGAVVGTDQACRLIAGEPVESWQVRGSVPLRFTYENASDLYAEL